MRAVYEKAGLDPLETQFVEAHGTGTAVGDPVEASFPNGLILASENIHPSLEMECVGLKDLELLTSTPSRLKQSHPFLAKTALRITIYTLAR